MLQAQNRLRVRFAGRSGIAAMAFLASAAAANAHTSFMMPSTFSTSTAETVTVQASFAETHFFRPEIAVESQDFHFYRPDGTRAEYSRIESFKQVTILESPLAETGTYRFTTGERLGRTSKLIIKDGEYIVVEPGKPIPEGARTIESQTATVSDVYVSKGAPTDAVIDITVGRLAIRPLGHPSAVYRDEGFAVTLTFDGKPLSNHEIEIEREGGDYESPRFGQTLKTSGDGRADIKFDRAGAYIIMARHRADAPAGSATPLRSYTTSLTFEVAN